MDVVSTNWATIPNIKRKRMAIEIINNDDLPPDHVDGSAMSYLPETAAELDEPAFSPPADGPLPGEPVFQSLFDDTEKKEKKKDHRKKLSKKMKATIEQFREMFTDGIAAWFTNQAIATGRPEWALEPKDAALIGDSVGFVLDVLDIDIDIEPIDVEITSPWWTLLYPLAAFGIVFFRRQSTVKQKYPEETQL
jgi:hypothetical protein